MKKLFLLLWIIALHATANAATIKMANFTSTTDTKKVFDSMKTAETSDGKRLETSDGTLECAEDENKKFACALMLEESKAEVEIVNDTTVRFSGKIAEKIWNEVDAKVVARIGATTREVANLSCWIGSNPRYRSVKCQAKRIRLTTVRF